MAKKRKKRRPRTGAPSPKPQASPAARRRAAAGDERPPAPWGSFPLVELVILAGLVSVIVGFAVGGGRGPTLVVVGLTLGALGGLELSIREHFGGFRSHTTLLSGACGVAVLAALAFLTSLWLPVALAISAAVGLASAWLLTRAFQRRSGRAFKIR
jgi:hypothetical protein